MCNRSAYRCIGTGESPLELIRRCSSAANECSEWLASVDGRLRLNHCTPQLSGSFNWLRTFPRNPSRFITVGESPWKIRGVACDSQTGYLTYPNERSALQRQLRKDNRTFELPLDHSPRPSSPGTITFESRAANEYLLPFTVVQVGKVRP